MYVAFTQCQYIEPNIKKIAKAVGLTWFFSRLRLDASLNSGLCLYMLTEWALIESIRVRRSCG